MKLRTRIQKHKRKVIGVIVLGICLWGKNEEVLNRENDSKTRFVINEASILEEAKIAGTITEYLGSSKKNLVTAKQQLKKNTGIDYEELVSRLPSESRVTRFYSLSTECGKGLIIHDYGIGVQLEQGEIEIRLSSLGEPIRDVLFSEKDSASSYIAGNEVKIYSIGTMMGYGTFRVRNVFYDIENNGCSMEEFKSLLVRIVKRGKAYHE